MTFNPYDTVQLTRDEKATFGREQAALAALWSRLREWGHAWYVNPSQGGYTAACTCGWTADGTFPNEEAALTAHDKHRRSHR